MPVKAKPPEARKFHTLGLALETGGLYVGGLIDMGIGPQRHGEGTRYYKDKTTIAYQGSYKCGRWDGYGERFGSGGRLIYKGHFSNDLYHGKGTYFGDNGEYYEGDWFEGLKHGMGIYVKQNGEKYVGTWKQNRYHGPGELHNNEGTLVYKGTCDNGIRVGKCYYLNEATGEIFDGQHAEGVLHGEAKYVDENKNSYEGTWNMGVREGYGISVQNDGSKYIGQWKNDMKNGEGADTDKDGYTLKGIFTDGYLEEDGTLYFPNKAVAYEGEFQKSKFHGLGEVFRGDGALIYSGTFINGKYNGYGNLYMENNGYYYGYWKNGLRHTGHIKKDIDKDEDNNSPPIDGGMANDARLHDEGEEEDEMVGEFRDGHGWVYSGEWINDERHGHGKLYDSSGALVYDGKFVHNVASGKGQFYYNSTMMKGSDFKGTFINGKKEGFGILTYKDGTVVYKGTYVKDVRHGEGEWQDLYGTTYKGIFINDKRTGDGELQLNNGDFYKGSFEDGKYHGRGVLVKRNALCDGYFEHGKYLESDEERIKRLQSEELEMKRRELKRQAIAEQMRRRDAALKRRADAKAKALAALSNWGEDEDDEDINAANERILAESEKKKHQEIASEEAKQATIEETPENEALPSLVQQKRLDLLTKRGSRALNRKKIPRRHGKGVSETEEIKRIERKSLLSLPKIGTVP